MRSQVGRFRSALFVFGLTAAVTGAHADDRGEELLREVARATKAIPSLGAKLQVTMTTQNLAGRPTDLQSRQSDSGFAVGNEPVSFTYTGNVKLLRPNLERVELDAPVNQLIDCDGTALWTLLSSNEYIKNPADPLGKSPGSYAPVLIFFAPETARTAGTIPTEANSAPSNFAVRYLGKERAAPKSVRSTSAGGGVPARTEPEEFDVVEVRQLRPLPQAIKLYINADHLVTRVVSEMRRDSNVTTQDIWLLNVKASQKFTPSEFVFDLPANARPFKINSGK